MLTSQTPLFKVVLPNFCRYACIRDAADMSLKFRKSDEKQSAIGKMLTTKDIFMKLKILEVGAICHPVFKSF